MMYLLPFLAQHGPGATGAQCTLDGLLPGQPSSDYYTANSYITPGPGATCADCGRDRSRPPDSLPVPPTLPRSFISSSLHFATDLQSSFLQPWSLTPSIAWPSAPHCLNCPTRKPIHASCCHYTVGTATTLSDPPSFSPPSTLHYLHASWVVF